MLMAMLAASLHKYIQAALSGRELEDFLCKDAANLPISHNISEFLYTDNISEINFKLKVKMNKLL